MSAIIKERVEEKPIIEDTLNLVVGDNLESQMALDFLYYQKLDCYIHLKNNVPKKEDGSLDLCHSFSNFPHVAFDYYFNSAKESSLPILIVKRDDSLYGAWHSLSGVRNYWRDNLLWNMNHDMEGGWKNDFEYWSRRNQDSSYPDSIVCLDKSGKISYKGPVENAPLDLKGQLEKRGLIQEERLIRENLQEPGYNFNGWRNVVSWEIGSLDELAKLKDDVGRGRIIKPETRTVLFAEELEDLQKGRKEEIIISDKRTYSTYFKQGENLFGFTADLY